MPDYRCVVVLLSNSDAIAALMRIVSRCNASIVASSSNEMLDDAETPPPHWQMSFNIKFYVMADLELFEKLMLSVKTPGVIEQVANDWDWMPDPTGTSDPLD